MVNSALQSFLQNMTEFEILMNNVERVRYFASEVSQEAPYTLADEGSPGTQMLGSAMPWPSAGIVRFSNVSAKYRKELPRGRKDPQIQHAGSFLDI